MADTAGIINGIDDMCQRVGLAGLSPTDRAVCLVNWLRFEVEMGGLGGFYGSSSGDHAPLMIDALREINAPRAADVLARANALIQGPGQDWPDRAARHAAVAQVADETSRTLQQAMSADGPPEWADRLEDYVERNEPSFAHVPRSRLIV